MFIKDGQPFNINGQHEIDGIIYPSGFFNTAESRAEMGITEVADPPPTPPTITDMWGRIKAERDRRVQNGGYLADGHWFHSDTFSRTQQIGLVMLGTNIPANTLWKTMDDGYVLMTQTLANQIFAAAVASDALLFSKAVEHKTAMEASPTPWTYNYMTGWPLAYGE